MIHGISLAVVDACDLDDERRRLLRPGAPVVDARGVTCHLPRFFFEVPSWEAAERTMLTRHFALYELIDVDLHEPAALRLYPRYVPCAVTLLAAHLEVLRVELGASVHIAANGGYRSPSHAKSKPGSTHAWGTAADIYRVGDEYLDTPESIRRHALLAAALLPGLYVKPDEDGRGWTDDHIHVDLGYVTAVPQEASGRGA